MKISNGVAKGLKIGCTAQKLETNGCRGSLFKFRIV